MENIYWKKTVGTLIGAIWLYTLADLAASITGAVDEFLNPSGVLGMFKDLMDGGNGVPTLSMGDMIESMFSILVLVGYYLFFRSLIRFARLQPNLQDGKCVSTVCTAYILLVVALIADFIPLIGWLASFVLIVIAYVKMLSGYRGLKKSATFPLEARQGASTLYSCTIWTLVAYVLGCIPLFGGIIEGIITLVVFFTILSAWGHIKNGASEMTLEEETIYKRDEVPAYKQVLGDALILYFFIVMLNFILGLSASLYIENFDVVVFFNRLLLIIIGTIYIWLLLTSKAQLDKWAKGGLVLLLISHLIYFDISCKLLGLFSEIGREFLIDYEQYIYMAGMMLFIWRTYATIFLKILVTVYSFWYVFNSSILRYIDYIIIDVKGLVFGRDSDIYLQALPGYLHSIIELGFIVVIFILTCFFVYKWRAYQTNTTNN